MRQGKLSELIHNSARYPDLDECSVEVHFREIIDLVHIFLSIIGDFGFAHVAHPAGPRCVQGSAELEPCRGAYSVPE